MVVERNLIMSLLKLTKDGPILIEDVKKDSRLTLEIVMKLLQKLQKEGVVYVLDDKVEASSEGRLLLAAKAASLGMDVEQASSLLRWQEFESIATLALKKNGYDVAKNVRFKHAGRRWEIDVVGCRKPLVICVDCKHYHHGLSPSAMMKIADAQVERTKALAETLPNVAFNVNCVKWVKAKFVPVVLSLLPASFRFCDNVPIVPVLQLQDFLNQLPAYANSLTYFQKAFQHL
jgi:Holliday junction resolvase-like predicted endonuclease